MTKTPRSSLLRVVLLSVVLLTISALALGCARPAQPATTPAPTATATTEPATSPASTPSSSTSSAVTTPTQTPTKPAAAQVKVHVFFVRGEYLGAGAMRNATASSPAKGAMQALLAGPTGADTASRLRSQIPKGTKLLGLSVSKGTATVDLSKRFESGGGTLSMTLRIAQVVNTLAQFPNVKRVAFKLDGKKVTSIGGEGIIVSPPVTPKDFASTYPAIFLTQPVPGATITSPVRLKGTADVFEAVFRVKITDAAGKVVCDRPVTATSGTGTRGTFDTRVKFSPTRHGKGWLTVYEPSAKDGTPIHVVKIRVTM